MNIIVTIEGGAGKNVVFSAVAKAIKKKYPDDNLIVVTPYPEVLLNNPNIDRIYKLGLTQYFYDECIKDKEVLFLTDEPYKNSNYLKQDQHIIESWCNMLNVPFNNETPEIFLNPLEIQQAVNQIAASQKPVLFFQPFGGGSPEIKYSWNRDIPPHQAQQLVNILNQKYHIVQCGRPDQITLQKVEKVSGGFRSMFGLLAASNRRILIDSVYQHAAAAFGVKSTVCWITNTPKVWGYEFHRNIFPVHKIESPKHNVDSFLMEFDFGGSRVHDYPFPDNNIFNIEEIVEPLLAQ